MCITCVRVLPCSNISIIKVFALVELVNRECRFLSATSDVNYANFDFA